MAVISGGFGTHTDIIEEKLYQTDFSKHTDLKARLAAKLFKNGTAKVTRFTPLSDDEVELVNAAQGIWDEKPHDF